MTDCDECNQVIEEGEKPIDFDGKVLCQPCAKDKRDELDEKLQDAELDDDEEGLL